MPSNYDTYSPIAIEAANQYGVPVNMFLWQIGQESGWNPTARNPTPGSTATGLGQFINSTAQERGVIQTDPVSSLYGAASYMRSLYDRATGRGLSGDDAWMQALNSYGTTAGGGSSLLSQARAALSGSGASTPATESAASECGTFDIRCRWEGYLRGMGRSANTANASGSPMADATQQCGTFDFACQFMRVVSFTSSWMTRITLVVLGLIIVAFALWYFRPGK